MKGNDYHSIGVSSKHIDGYNKANTNSQGSGVGRKRREEMER